LGHTFFRIDHDIAMPVRVPERSSLFSVKVTAQEKGAVISNMRYYPSHLAVLGQ
jgi:hypothetical protein